MKKMLITLMMILGLVMIASAAGNETVIVKRGQQKTAAKGEITIKFVSVTEDSRCPVDANCIWAGNAAVQVKVTTRGRGTKMMTMNTNSGPQGDQFNGWAINLTSLTPAPKSTKATNPKSYTATFSIQRLTR